jgi:hypothetical protein
VFLSLRIRASLLRRPFCLLQCFDVVSTILYIVTRNAQVGYTLSCWLRVTGFHGDESPFLRWSNSSGSQILELYFQQIGAQGDAARCMSVRTHAAEMVSPRPVGASAKSQAPDQGGRFAFNAFNAHSFAADGVWHHATFTQCNRTISLYLDGAFVQSCSFTTYPSPNTGATPKDRCLIGILGGDDTSAGFFSGELSCVTLAGERTPFRLSCAYGRFMCLEIGLVGDDDFSEKQQVFVCVMFENLYVHFVLR